jgi:hypothetical protein
MQPIFSLHEDNRFSQAVAPFFTHEYLTYYSTIPHDWINEKASVPIENNPQYQDWAIGPKHVDKFKESGKIVRNINPLSSYDCAIRNGDFKTEIPNVEIEPWKILVLYVTEPDLDLDCDLDIHWSQKITKGSHGLRHMQFKLFGFQIGRSEESFRYYYKTAQRAWDEGNKYWAWRFLSRATHYLADLGHPFHVKVMPSSLILKSLLKPKKLFQTLTTAHNGHEVFTQYRFRTGYDLFKEKLIQGSQDSLESQKTVLEYLPKYKKNAVDNLSALFKALFQYFGKDLIMAYENIDDNKDIDASKSTFLAEAQAQKVIFQDPNNPGLKILDEKTADLLYEVGFIIGLLYKDMKKKFI